MRGRSGGAHNFLNDIYLFNTNFIESLYVQHGIGYHNRNKQTKNPTILVLLTMNEKGGVIYKLCRSCEY